METFEINAADIPLLEPPQNMANAPRRILYVIFKHKGFICSAFLILFLSVLLAVLLSPTEYRATTTVMIKPSRAYVNMSPTGSQPTLSINPSPETLNSEIQIIRSLDVMERVVKEIPFPETNENGAHAADTQMDLRRAASRLRGKVKATPVRLTNLIQISVESPYTEWATSVVNKVADYYLDQHLKIHKTQGVEEFYDEQEKKLQLEMLRTEKALKDFQQREGIVDAGQEVAANLTGLANFERSLKETESAIRETEERVGILSAQLKEQRENVKTGAATSSNPVYSKIRERLVQLELERNSLLQRYTPKDRMVQDKEREIAELRQNLSAEVQKMVGSESASLNSIHDGILNALLGSRAQLQGLKEKRNVLLKQVASYSSVAADKKKKSYEYERLQGEVMARREALALYRKKAEEARISDAMDDRKFGNVAVFERAALPLPRASFSPLIIGIIAFIISLGIAVGLAFGIEFFNTAIRNESDVEERIGLPVLATIQDHRV